MKLLSCLFANFYFANLLLFLQNTAISTNKSMILHRFLHIYSQNALSNDSLEEVVESVEFEFFIG